MAQLPFALGQSSSGIPLTSSMSSTLQTGMQGGTGTATFVSDQIVQNNFFQYVGANDQTAWIWSTDTNGNPAFFAAQQSGGNTMYLEGTATIDAAATANPGSSGQFTWNNQSYNIIGTLTTTLGYNTTPLWYVQVPLGIATSVPAGYLAGIVWSTVLKPLMTGCWTGLKSCISKCSQAEDADDVDDAADDAANDASFEGAEAGEDVVDLAVGAAAFMGLAVVVAIPIVVMALAHNSFSHVQVYNLTQYDLVWSLAYQDSGQMYIEPTTSQTSGTAEYTIPAMSSWAPPGITAVPSAHEADFAYTNTNQFEGFGYVMQFALNTAGGTTQIDTGTVMLYVPLEGSNALATATGTLSSVEDWYNTNESNAANFVTQSVAQDSNFVVTATFDYLTGQHPGPGGSDQYYYNSLIVFAPPAAS